MAAGPTVASLRCAALAASNKWPARRAEKTLADQLNSIATVAVDWSAQHLQQDDDDDDDHHHQVGNNRTQNRQTFDFECKPESGGKFIALFLFNLLHSDCFLLPPKGSHIYLSTVRATNLNGRSELI